MIAHTPLAVNKGFLGYTKAMQAFIQSFLARYYQSVFAVIIVLVVGAAFYAGILEGKRTTGQSVTLSCNKNILSKLSIPLEKLANGVTANATSGSTDSPAVTEAMAGHYVGSKNGTKYYASPSCSGAKRIKPENYLWFTSAEDAQIQGYSPGKC